MKNNSISSLDDCLKEYLELQEDQELGSSPSLEDYNEFLKVALENGVENKKKELEKCNCHKTQCIMANNIGKLCIYKNVICDPEYFKG